jgi:hypothetical protein
MWKTIAQTVGTFLTLIALGFIGWTGALNEDADAPVLTPTPTPWGMPPWANRWVVVACSLRDSAHPTPNAAGEITFDGTNTVCYSLPPDDIAWQIVEAAAAWGLPGGQVTRCKSAVECAVEGGWTFRPAPEEFPCRPVPWSIAKPPIPYGTPTPIQRETTALP